MGFLIYNLFTISSADSMKLLEPDLFDRKEKQTEKKNNPRKRSVSYLLIWSAYNLLKNFNKLNRKLFLMTDQSGQIIQKQAVNLRSK